MQSCGPCTSMGISGCGGLGIMDFKIYTYLIGCFLSGTLDTVENWLKGFFNFSYY